MIIKQIIAIIACIDRLKEQKNLSARSGTNFHSSIKASCSSVDCTFWLNTRMSWMAAATLPSIECLSFFATLAKGLSIKLDSSRSAGFLESLIGTRRPNGDIKRHERRDLMTFNHVGRGRSGRTWYMFMRSVCMRKLMPQTVRMLVR